MSCGINKSRKFLEVAAALPAFADELEAGCYRSVGASTQRPNRIENRAPDELLTTLVSLTILLIANLGGPLLADDYFTIQVIDSETERGVPLVELLAPNGSTLVSDSNGIVAFNQPGMMNQDVFFGLRSYGYSDSSQTLRPSVGSSVQISIDRTNRAERLYRVTGTGIYGDSVLVGANVPIDEPLLNANVRGQDSVQTAVYNGQIYWFWGDTLYEQGALGNFRTAGARSQLPGQGGLDPSQGVNLDYFVDANGWAKQMMPVSQPGAMWIDGVFTVFDDGGQERLFARNERYLENFENVEQGLALFNDATQTFQRFQSYSLDAPITPQGHSFRHTTGGQEYIYFSLTYPNVRVKANWFDVTHVSTWEAFTPLRENTRYDSANPALDLDGSGNVIFGWKKNADPLSYEMLEDLVQQGHLARDELPFRLENAATGEAVRLHRSSVHWNEFRQSWVMIGVESWGDSFLGEVWFAEAPAPEGPWEGAVKVASHDRGSNQDYTFYNPTSHPFFDQAGGRYIYFEGTYANTFSGNPNQTPLYDYNQMMYRLDLATIPNLFPRLDGDYNRDGVVDAGDYVVWRKTDVNGPTGYDTWRTNFGEPGGSGSVAGANVTVPEPATLMSLIVAAVGIGMRRRQIAVSIAPAHFGHIT
jgi:hypothetical protein